jgi:hypothetical protein
MKAPFVTCSSILPRPLVELIHEPWPRNYSCITPLHLNC